MPGHERCRQLFLEWRTQVESLYLTWGIIYEFLRVSTHPNILRKPFSFESAWRFVSAVLASPSAKVLHETERHGQILEEMASGVVGIGGNLLFDIHTAVLMREHGIKRIYTHDADFRRFPFLEVIDPLQ